MGALLGSAAAAAAVTSGTFAAWEARTASPGNSISAKPDWMGPTVAASATSKGSGSPGFIRAGGTYYVYGRVEDDTGAPPSGLGQVSANVSTITSGTTSATLQSGTWTIDGQTYNRRTSALTAASNLSEGPRTLTVTARDLAGNITNAPGAVMVDNTAPTTADVQARNKPGGVAGRLEAGDSLTYTFSERVEPDTLLAGFTGSAMTVTVQAVHHGSGDHLEVTNAAGNVTSRLGEVALNDKNFVTATRAFVDSTMVMSSSAPWTVTVTLGTPSGAVGTVTTARSMSWQPLTGITDMAGNVVSTARRNEGGPSDVDF